MFNKHLKQTIHSLTIENQELKTKLNQAICLKNEMEANLNANSKAFRELSIINERLRYKLSKFDRKKVNGRFVSENPQQKKQKTIICPNCKTEIKL